MRLPIVPMDWKFGIILDWNYYKVLLLTHKKTDPERLNLKIEDIGQNLNKVIVNKFFCQQIPFFATPNQEKFYSINGCKMLDKSDCDR